jgi:hypothetical protein
MGCIILETIGVIAVEDVLQNKRRLREVSDAGHEFTQEIPGPIVPCTVVIQKTLELLGFLDQVGVELSGMGSSLLLEEIVDLEKISRMLSSQFEKVLL